MSNETRISVEDVLDIIEKQVIGIYASRSKFSFLIKLCKNNPNLDLGHPFVAWICNNYVIAANLEVRKLLDKDKRSASLKQLFRILKYKATDYNKQFFVDRYSDHAKCIGKDVYEKHFGRDEIPNLAEIEKLLNAAIKNCENIKKYVDKKIAHSDIDIKDLYIPTYEELDKAIDSIGEAYKLFHLLIKGSCYNSLEPVPQYNYYALFSESWWVEQCQCDD